MFVVYFSNFLNHHQKPVADQLFAILGTSFTFVETVPMADSFKQSGYTDYSNEKYVLRAWESERNKSKAVELAKTADVALFGGPDVLYLEVIRARSGNKLSFDVSERWLKKGLLNLLSPRIIKSLYYYHTIFKYKPFYKLCASSFAAKDQYCLLTYRGRCFKWGYFTKVDDYEIQKQRQENSASDITPHIMWCARFLRWKHPELPVKLAARLKSKGYRIVVDMYGNGKELERTKSLSAKLDVRDIVNFYGNRPNDEILKEMRNHNIFLFTSDRNEGWGAVLNEAMSNGCTVVGSNQIGSVPYLINDGINGCIFKSECLDSLEEKVEYLLNNPVECKSMARNAYIKLKQIWSPENAARNLLTLIDDLNHGRESSIKDGPCSKALPI